jgi:hypothetical protein
MIWVAGLLFVRHTKTDKDTPINLKYATWPQNIPNRYIIDQMDT